jgi:transcriptional regulator with XRE-family HTH domain
MEKKSSISKSPTSMREYRKENKITLTQVSFYSKVHKDKISKYENELIELTNEEIYKILLALDKLSKM